MGPACPVDKEGMNAQIPDAERAAAFEQLYRQYQPELYLFACRWLRDPDQAGDILQESYLKAWRAWPAVYGGNLRAWLYRITANTIRDLFRKQRRRSIFHLASYESLDANLVDVQATMELSRFDTREQIRAALRDLPDHYRTVLLMYGSYSYREIARDLHLSVSATRMRIYRARQAFAAHYLEQAARAALPGGRP